MKNIQFEYKNLITGKEWYHQRFDGCPMFIFAIADAEMLKEKRKPQGTYPKVRVCFFGDSKADWHLDMEDVRNAADVLISLAKKDTKVSAKLLKAWKKDEIVYEKFFWKEFSKINLSLLTNKELLDLWKRYYKLTITRLSSTGIIDHFALGTDQIIHEMLKKEIIAQRNGLSMKDSEFANIFSIATAPTHQSFINAAEIELLKIITGDSKQKIEDYQKKYYWLKNNYVTSQVLTTSYFKKEIEVWKKSRKNLKEEIQKLQSTPKESKLRKQGLFKQYKLSPLLKTLLKISEDFTYWQDERKKATYFNIHMGCILLGDISKRFGYTVEELKYATASEIETIFSSKQPSKDELKKRMKNSVFVITSKGYTVETGSTVKVVRDLMWKKQQKKKITDFRGLTASLGKARGRVRIVKSVNEISKVQKGDILVAVMTRPDYVPAMKKAAAIVTNEGGVTSHAAIVSRELGIPCIIGTKIATEVLKDGDMVEVNANHGIVKIVN